MRVMVITYGADSAPTSGYQDVDQMSEVLATHLAVLGRTRTRDEFEDGRVVIYGKIEYECVYCDEYGHDGSECPFTEDDLSIPDTEEERAERMAQFNLGRTQSPEEDDDEAG